MKKHIEAFDTLRGAAATAIFFGHMEFMSQYSMLYNIALPSSGAIVTLFFILSGVVITLSQYEQMKDGITRTEYAAFVRRRLRSVYPVYIITMLAGMVYSFAGETLMHNWSLSTVIKSVGKVVLAATLTQSAVPRINVAQCFNGAAWYLSALFLLWLVTPWLMRLVKKAGGGYLLPAAALTLLLHAAAQSLAQWLDSFGEDLSFCGSTPYVRVFPYFFGMLLGRWLLLHPQPPSAAVCRAAAICGCVGTLFSLYGFRQLPLPLGDMLRLISFALLLWAAAQTSTGFSGALAACRPLHWLGTRSLEIYLIHYPIRIIGYTVLTYFWGEGPVQARLCLVLFATSTLALSAWTHKQMKSRTARQYK